MNIISPEQAKFELLLDGICVKTLSQSSVKNNPMYRKLALSSCVVVFSNKNALCG